MRISDWSSDVCSSDLHDLEAFQKAPHGPHDQQEAEAEQRIDGIAQLQIFVGLLDQIAIERPDEIDDRQRRQYRDQPQQRPFGFQPVVDRNGKEQRRDIGEGPRSEERRVGKDGVSPGRERWWRYIEKKNKSK